MRTIHKYPLVLTFADQRIGTPRVWRPVHVAMQHGEPTVWAEVDTDTGDGYERMLRVVGTGHPVPDEYEHVGSSLDGPYVWHVYVKPWSP